jgi:signal transduction histidine kinase
MDKKFKPNQLTAPEHAAVLRDFERSRIEQLRTELQERFWPLTIAYVAFVAIWTVVMSFGAMRHGNITFAYNLAPHVAHFTLIIGLIVYPRNRIWVPLVVFSALFAIPFFVPDPAGYRWIDNPKLSLNICAVVFFSQILSGTLVGASARFFTRYIKKVCQPYTVDLLTSLAVFFFFLFETSAQMLGVWHYVQSLPSVDLNLLGYDDHFLRNAFERIVRGANVTSIFLLAIMIAPSRKETLAGLALAATFPLLVKVQEAGFAMHPTLDVMAIAAFMVLTLPLGLAVTAIVVGIPIYAGITGAFLQTIIPTNPEAGWLEIYTTIALTVIVFIVALRAHLVHAEKTRSASFRRMSMVRDFANVGLFSFNLNHCRYSTDCSSQRILNIPAEGYIPQFLQNFEGKDLAELTAALKIHPRGQVTLLLSHQSASNTVEPQIVRMFLWYETAPSGDDVAYGLVLDVTDEHRQERSLQETYAELTSKQERQRQLFSIISHELRTPASVISMLLDELNDLETLPRNRKLLRDATDQLMSTLADMRQTVNPTKNLPLKLVPYTAADLAESVRNMFLAQAEEQGMVIRLALGEAAQRVRIGDQMRVRQALSNLIRNAIIHSHATEVTLHFNGKVNGANMQSGWSIIDNGVGIPASEVDRLFEPFERGIQDPRSQADGSGLGLFIAKSSIEMLGGEIAHFQPASGGTGYAISLQEALPDVIQASAKVQKLNPADTETFPNLYILLAEDNKLVSEVTKAKLRRFVGRVDVVFNGPEALAHIAATAPDLLITDLFMPEMDGDVLARTLRQQGYGLPIIGITAAVVGDDMDRFRIAGADHVMSKPIEMRQLRSILSELQKQERFGPISPSSQAL